MAVLSDLTGTFGLQKDVVLAPFSWWRIGGPADLFYEVHEPESLALLLRHCQGAGIPVCVIGRGTNLLFDDAGFRGCVVRIGAGVSGIQNDSGRLKVGAGCWVPRLAFYAARHGLAGLEHTIGIPASIGGLVYMNGGTQRRGIGDHIENVTSISLDGSVATYTHDECEFGYRESRFQRIQEVILSATLKLWEPRPYAEQRPELLSILSSRRKKFPRKLPSCGSVFKSSAQLFQAVGPPGQIIEELGFKGVREGQLEVSPKHANFITNLGSGSSGDVLNLVRRIHRKVRVATGISMEPEFQYLHPLLGILPPESWL